MNMDKRRAQFAAMPKETLVELLLLADEQVAEYAKVLMKQATPNIMSVMDFRIESSESLDVCRKHLDALIEKHHDFSVWRRTKLVQQNEIVKGSYFS